MAVPRGVIDDDGGLTGRIRLGTVQAGAWAVSHGGSGSDRDRPAWATGRDGGRLVHVRVTGAAAAGLLPGQGVLELSQDPGFGFLLRECAFREPGAGVSRVRDEGGGQVRGT